jgi:hypothetical protein
VVPQRRPVLWPPARPEWLTALVTIAALVVVGAALAPLWVHLAPRLAFRVDQPGRALPVVPEAEEYIAADGRFVIITLVVGVLAGLGCWLVRRARGPLVLLALAVAGLLGAVVTWRLGVRIGTGYRPDDLQVVGKVIYQPLMLRARSALVVEPVAAVVCYLLAVGFSARNDLGRDELGRDGLGRDELGRDELGRDGLGRDGLGRDELGRDGLGRDGLGRDGLGRDEQGRDEQGRDEQGRDELGRDELGRDDAEPVASTDAGPAQGVPAPDAPSSSSA